MIPFFAQRSALSALLLIFIAPLALYIFMPYDLEAGPFHFSLGSLMGSVSAYKSLGLGFPEVSAPSHAFFLYLFVRKIIFFGRSIGTGPAVKIASERECGGIVLVSPYTSVKVSEKQCATFHDCLGTAVQIA